MIFELINFYFYLLLIINILLTVLLYKSFRIINEFKKILIEFNDIQITNKKNNETVNEFNKILIELNDIQLNNQKSNEIIVDLLKLNLLSYAHNVLEK